MSSPRPGRRVSGSTARLVEKLALYRPETAANIARRHYGFTRRDLHPRRGEVPRA